MRRHAHDALLLHQRIELPHQVSELDQPLAEVGGRHRGQILALGRMGVKRHQVAESVESALVRDGDLVDMARSEKAKSTATATATAAPMHASSGDAHEQVDGGPVLEAVVAESFLLVVESLATEEQALGGRGSTQAGHSGQERSQLTETQSGEHLDGDHAARDGLHQELKRRGGRKRGEGGGRRGGRREGRWQRGGGACKSVR